MVTDDLVDRYFSLIHRAGNLDAFIRIANTKLVQNTNNLSEINIPVLIIWGDKDRWLSPKHAEYFNNDIPNSSVLMYENVGHIPMEEIPERSAIDVRNFLLAE